MKVKSGAKLITPCDHRLRPTAYSGTRFDTSKLWTPDGDVPPVNGIGTVKCQDCGKVDAIDIPDFQSWLHTVNMLRPVRDRYTNRPLFRLPWSVVVKRVVQGA